MGNTVGQEEELTNSLIDKLLNGILSSSTTI